MISFADSNNFEIYVMDIVDKYKPKDAEDYEILSDELHQSVEIAICDMIEDSDNGEKIMEEYEPRY